MTGFIPCFLHFLKNIHQELYLELAYKIFLIVFYIPVINLDYFNYLKINNFFTIDKTQHCNDIYNVIVYKEIGISQIAITNNWNINCILPLYSKEAVEIVLSVYE